MTAKQFVQSSVPRAHLEKQQTNGGERYYLIRNGNNPMYMASGKTPGEAWKKAKELVVVKQTVKA